jgi:hypothetical protein
LRGVGGRLPLGRPAPMFKRYSRPAGLVLCRTPATAAQQPNITRKRGALHIAVRVRPPAMQTDNLSLGLASLQRETAAGRSLPPVERWNPAHCGDIDIRIARDGAWYHQGSPFTRRELVRLFSTILKKEGDAYYLVTPAEKMRIQVEDVPFLAVLLDADGAGPSQTLTFTTNVGDLVTAGPDNPIRVETDLRTGQPAPYVHVRRGLEARISRTVFFQLAEMAVPQGDFGSVGVWSCGQFFALGSAE